MSARHSTDDHVDAERTVATLAWFGGCRAGDLEGRSTAPLIGALVLLGGLAAWLVAAGAAMPATGWRAAAAFSIGLVFAAAVVAAIRSTVSTARGMWIRVAVATAVGLAVGELAATILFSTAIAEHLRHDASAQTSAAPAVSAADSELDAARAARKSLDDAVDAARQRRDAAQVVARCEYQPAPTCPQQDITGVAGNGQITQNTQDVLERSQRELDTALTARDQQSPALDAGIMGAEHAATLARQSVIGGADQGFGARWIAMNEYTAAAPAAMALRVLVTLCFILLYLLPLLLHARQDRTVRDRHQQSRLNAELEAETAIAVTRAQARAEAEALQAEHQLTNMRLALEADTAINREYHKQRIADAVAEPAALTAHIEAGRALTESDDEATPARPALPASAEVSTDPAPSDNLPAVAAKNQSPIPVLPDIAGAAARFLRPLVPPVITQVVENSTAQLRSAQKVFEEIEEFTFSFRRTTRVTTQDTEHQRSPQADRAAPTVIEHTDVTVLGSSSDPAQLESGRRAIER